MMLGPCNFRPGPSAICMFHDVERHRDYSVAMPLGVYCFPHRAGNAFRDETRHLGPLIQDNREPLVVGPVGPATVAQPKLRYNLLRAEYTMNRVAVDLLRVDLD